jgi:hypothetical protein
MMMEYTALSAVLLIRRLLPLVPHSCGLPGHCYERRLRQLCDQLSLMQHANQNRTSLFAPYDRKRMKPGLDHDIDGGGDRIRGLDRDHSRAHDGSNPPGEE